MEKLTKITDNLSPYKRQPGQARSRHLPDIRNITALPLHGCWV